MEQARDWLCLLVFLFERFPVRSCPLFFFDIWLCKCARPGYAGHVPGARLEAWSVMRVVPLTWLIQQT